MDIVNIKNNGFTVLNESLNRYIRTISQYEVLTPDMEVDLFIKIKAGDEDARQRIMMSNQRFVLSAAKTYTQNPTMIMDLIQEGNIGLSEAIETFDITRGFKFITYAVHYIRRSMSTYIKTSSFVLDKTKGSVKSVVKKIREDYFNEFHCEITPSELKLRVEEELGEKFKDCAYFEGIHVTSIEDNVDEDHEEDSSRIALVSASVNDAEKELDDEDDSNTVDNLMKSLTPKERIVIKMSFGIGEPAPSSDEMIADRLGMTREGVSSAKKRALAKMKKFSSK